MKHTKENPKQKKRFGKTNATAGAALLIALFVLLLISVVAFGMILASGMESSLTGYFKNSTSLYYAGVAGLEEARSRLMPTNPNPIQVPLAGQALYITNPSNGENVLATYPDNEYIQEFGNSPNVLTPVTSVSANNGIPGAQYKWVRINAVTEHALNIDVNQDAYLDNWNPLYYGFLNAPSQPSQQGFGGFRHHSSGTPGPPETPGLIIPMSTPPPNAVMALEITSMVVLPNNTQKFFQYVVTAPVAAAPNPSASTANQGFGFNYTVPMGFPAALTLAGNNVSYQAASGSSYVNGQDVQSGPGSNCGGSNFTSAIGYLNPNDASGIQTSAMPQSNYPGYPPVSGGWWWSRFNRNPSSMSPTIPSITNVSGGYPQNWQANGNPSLPPNWQTPAGLNALMQTITQNADVVVDGSNSASVAAALARISAASQANTPLTVVVGQDPSQPQQGNLDITGWTGTGTGLLLVTGNLTFDSGASWNGIIMVVGQGQMTMVNNGAGQINGAVFVAQTRDPSGNLLQNLGPSSFTMAGNGNGINYNSCWIQAVQGVMPYKVLSFREIGQPTS